MCEDTGKTVLPVLAVMMAASSAAHLTKYTNVTDPLTGQKKLMVVAQGMLSFNESIGFPVSLKDVEGMNKTILKKVLTAAKDPQLESKLLNMQLPLIADIVDTCMGLVLDTAWNGRPETVKI